ncbi:MAG: carboxypeptidase-like regulatory domain-containing protein [Tannerella sp.]|nr:carboxypeptidase-like regulatory domain-containing protein [Tannerella sp.]
METLCRPKNLCLLLLVLLTAGLPLPGLWAQDNDATGDFFTLSGLVKDAKSKHALEYVNVSVPGTPIGTVTNEDGTFTLKVSRSLNARAVDFTRVGYLSETIRLNGTDQAGLKILMTRAINQLGEVIVRPNDPRYLVEAAVSRIGRNYSRKSSLLTGFYRETAQKGRHYINISEAVIHIYKTAYGGNASGDRVQVFKGRSLLSQKRSDTLIVKLLGGPNLSVYLDVAKNLDLLLSPENQSYYAYRMEDPTMINKRPQYVISFQPQMLLPYALYEGKLYIDKERLSFTRAEFQLDMDDREKATQAILRKKPAGLRFRPLGVSFLVTYTERGGQTYLSYIRNQVRFRCDWKRRLFGTNYTITSEMVVTDSRDEGVDRIPYREAFKASQSLSDRVNDFTDPNFWGAYNIIRPTESLESAVNKLKKQRR